MRQKICLNNKFKGGKGGAIDTGTCKENSASLGVVGKNSCRSRLDRKDHKKEKTVESETGGNEKGQRSPFFIALNGWVDWDEKVER